MSIALVILPDFLLILLGWGLHRLFAFERPVWDGIERLIYYLLFPALLLRAIARTALDPSAAAPLILTALAFTACGVALSYAAQYLFRAPARVFASGFQCGFRFNSYVGLAVIGSLGGQAGIAALAITLGVMIPLVNVVSVWMLAHHGEGRLARELVRNPLIVATVAGMALNLAGLKLEATVDHFLELLAGAALPLGLMAVGAGLRLEGLAESRGLIGYWIALKLVLLPAIAWGIGTAMGLSGLYLQTAVLLAALPTASSAYILAVRMGGEGRPVATLITLGTLLSMLTIPVWMVVVG